MSNIERSITGPTPNLPEGAIGVKINQFSPAEQPPLPSGEFEDTLHIQKNQDAGLIAPPQGRAVAATTTNVFRFNEGHVHRALTRHGFNPANVLTTYPEHADLLERYKKSQNDILPSDCVD